ncbi:MAG: hypothetical protein R6X34_28870 [Chloroflexota bacterium]
MPWYATLSISALLIGLTLLLFILSGFGWLVGWLRNRGVKRPLTLHLSRWTAVFFILALLSFFLAFASLMSDVDPAFGVPRLFFGEASGVELVLLLPWLVAAAAVGLSFWFGEKRPFPFCVKYI